MLSWLADDEEATNIINDNYLLDINTRMISDGFLDSSVDLNSIESLCTESTFKRLEQVLTEKKKNPKWKCSSCRKSIGGMHCILCDSCLLWYHFKCITEQKKPLGEWIWPNCRQLEADGKT